MDGAQGAQRARADDRRSELGERCSKLVNPEAIHEDLRSFLDLPGIFGRILTSRGFRPYLDMYKGSYRYLTIPRLGVACRKPGPGERTSFHRSDMGPAPPGRANGMRQDSRNTPLGVSLAAGPPPLPPLGVALHQNYPQGAAPRRDHPPGGVPGSRTPRWGCLHGDHPAGGGDCRVQNASYLEVAFTLTLPRVNLMHATHRLFCLCDPYIGLLSKGSINKNCISRAKLALRCVGLGAPNSNDGDLSAALSISRLVTHGEDGLVAIYGSKFDAFCSSRLDALCNGELDTPVVGFVDLRNNRLNAPRVVTLPLFLTLASLLPLVRMSLLPLVTTGLMLPIVSVFPCMVVGFHDSRLVAPCNYRLDGPSRWIVVTGIARDDRWAVGDSHHRLVVFVRKSCTLTTCCLHLASDDVFEANRHATSLLDVQAKRYVDHGKQSCENLTRSRKNLSLDAFWRNDKAEMSSQELKMHMFSPPIEQDFGMVNFVLICLCFLEETLPKRSPLNAEKILHFVIVKQEHGVADRTRKDLAFVRTRTKLHRAETHEELDFNILLPRLAFLALLENLIWLASLALFSDFALKTCLLGFSRDFIWHIALEFCVSGILQDLMQFSTAEAGFLGLAQRLLHIWIARQPTTEVYWLRGFDLVDHGGLLAKEKYSRPFGVCWLKDFDSTDHDGLLAKKGITDLIGLLAKGFDLVDHGGLLTKKRG
ncbi:hypothetical protein Taro_006816 [Colocasia esculenta]|uniref:Uncharacterized protein n=1 Tax=Colocasia esculenta TaxID=4460 RepID=A0A843TYH2_COLES|nr:hypothetical protein [Colocasia esculenta]